MISDCNHTLIHGFNEQNEKNKFIEDDELPLEIINFPQILNNKEKQKQIKNINNYLKIDKNFENENIKKEIKEKIKNDDNKEEKVFDYVLANALKKGLNENEYYSKKNIDLKKKLKIYNLEKN